MVIKPMRPGLAVMLAGLMLAGCQPGHGLQERKETDPVPAEAVADAVPAQVASAAHPSLQVVSLQGQTLDLADLRGQWVVVNFWATWCSPCLKEMPELSALHERSKDVTVIGLAYEETDVPTLTAFLADHPVSYPVAIVDPFDPPADFATPRGLPMTFLIDPEGRLQEQYMGPVTTQQLEQAMAGTPSAGQGGGSAGS